jgi:hypothetical protein
MTMPDVLAWEAIKGFGSNIHGSRMLRILLGQPQVAILVRSA